MPIFRKNPFENNPLPTRKQGGVIPVLSARQLLSSRGHLALIEEVEQLSGLCKEEFDLLYRVFLERFAEFVQVLPIKEGAPYGSLLNKSLLQGINALHYYVGAHEEIDAVERYAMFTAGVLYGVDAALTLQSIFITEEGGTAVEDWQFSQGSLKDVGAQWYKIFRYKTNYSRLRDPITVLLARQIMPEDGYSWITRYWAVFTDWLDALCLSVLEGSRFSYILDIIRVDEEAVVHTGLPDIEFETRRALDTLLADEFFEWLDLEIKEGKLKTEGVEPDLYLMADGVFLDSRVIDRFAKYFNSPATVVYFQIGNALGIAKKGGQDFRFDQFFTTGGSGFLSSANSTVKGLYLSKQFSAAKGAISSHVKLQDAPPSRDFVRTVSRKNSKIRPNNDKK